MVPLCVLYVYALSPSSIYVVSLPPQVWDILEAACFDFAPAWESAHQLLTSGGYAATARINWSFSGGLVGQLEPVRTQGGGGVEGTGRKRAQMYCLAGRVGGCMHRPALHPHPTPSMGRGTGSPVAISKA